MQLLQLRHAHAVPGLRTTRTLAALDAAAAGGAGGGGGRGRAGRGLAAGRPGQGRGGAGPRPARRTCCPASQPELAAVASVLGYPPEADQDLVQDYRRAARRARAVMERLFYG